MGFDQESLERLDARGIASVTALTYVPPRRAGDSLANPRAFVCDDGHTYWTKKNSQYGLVAELVAGRLASTVAAGPIARVVEVPRAALPASGEANHLEGVVVGFLDVPDTENSKDLGALMGTGGPYDPGLVDHASLGLVVAFQSWLGVGDTQVLINMKNGRVHAIDHGDCLNAVDVAADPSPVVVNIPGVPPDLARERKFLSLGVDKIEQVRDVDLLDAVARVPDGPHWQSGIDRRLRIATWLADRRDKLRGVMMAWAR